MAIRLETDQELIDGTAAAAKLIRIAQAELTKRAGEIARRSEPRDDTSLARKMGTGSAVNLVAQVAGMPRAQAATIVASGVAFRPRENAFTGEPLPARFPQVAAAFADGLLDPEIAAATRRALAKAAPGLAPFEVDDLERQVLAFTQEGWDADTLLAYLRKVPEHAHPGHRRTPHRRPRTDAVRDPEAAAERAVPVGRRHRRAHRRVPQDRR